MRFILLIIGWVLMIGAAANAALALVALGFIGAGGFADFGMSVDALFSEHVPFMMWTKPAALAILPPHLAEFFFAAPALIVFPIRAVVALLIGAWTLKAARRRASA